MSQCMHAAVADTCSSSKEYCVLLVHVTPWHPVHGDGHACYLDLRVVPRIVMSLTSRIAFLVELVRATTNLIIIPDPGDILGTRVL